MNRGDRRELIFMAETTMTVGWIAERLAMGTRGYLNHLLDRRRKLGDPFAFIGMSLPTSLC